MEKNVLESVSYSLKKLKILIFAMQFILYKKCIPLRLRWSVEPQASVGLEMSPKGPKVLKNQEVKSVQDHYPDIINNQGMFFRCLFTYLFDTFIWQNCVKITANANKYILNISTIYIFLSDCLAQLLTCLRLHMITENPSCMLPNP